MMLVVAFLPWMALCGTPPASAQEFAPGGPPPFPYDSPWGLFSEELKGAKVFPLVLEGRPSDELYVLASGKLVRVFNSPSSSIQWPGKPCWQLGGLLGEWNWTSGWAVAEVGGTLWIGLFSADLGFTFKTPWEGVGECIPLPGLPVINQ